MEYSFTFNYWKLPVNGKMVPVTHDEFMTTAKAICDTISSIQGIGIRISNLETVAAYEADKKITRSEEDRKALEEGRKEYISEDCSEFTKDMWLKSKRVGFHITDEPRYEKELAISLLCDRLKTPTRIGIFGDRIQNEAVYKSVMDNFHKEGNLFVLTRAKSRLALKK